jgi:2-polyprenyl-6-hydroxyphenyl methylase/3-demethylubiquinone-9 3-methyltransferase
MSPQHQLCKICQSEAPLFGSIDFNKYSPAWGHFRPSLSGIQIFYNQCLSCNFLFSSSFDQWSLEDYAEHIYNDLYHFVDPQMTIDRPKSDVNRFINFFGDLNKDLMILDYGGGKGGFSEFLRQEGFKNVVSYDPFFSDFNRMPEIKFDIVTCFEVIEHVPFPMDVIENLSNLVKDTGLVLIGTALIPQDFLEKGLNWWYVMPRNGHISIFSREALNKAWGQFNFQVFQNIEQTSYHICYKSKPNFCPELI